MAQRQYTQRIPSVAPNMPASMQVLQSPHVEDAGYTLAQEALKAGQALGGWLVKEEDKRQKMQVDNAFLQGRAKMMEWGQEYKRQHQGQNALDAQAAFAKQWGEISSELTKQVGEGLSSENAYKLRRSMELGRLYALHDGGAYQDQQRNAFYKSVDESAVNNLLQEIAAASDDPDRRAMAMQTFKENYAARHPGIDNTAAFAKVDTMAAKTHIDKLLTQGTPESLQQAREFLASNSTTPTAGTGDGRIITTRGKKGSIADDQNNPWNLSKVGTSDNTPQRQRFAVYSSPEEGTRAAWAQLRRYNEGKLGSKVQVGVNEKGEPIFAPMNTLRGMVHKWQSGKKDTPAKVVSWMQKNGIDVDSPINMDTEQGQESVAKMMSFLAIDESSWKIPAAQILQAVRGNAGGNAGGGASASGILPSDRLALQARIDQKAREIAALQGLTEQNFKNRIAYGYETGDFGEARKIVQGLRSLGLAKSLPKMDEMLTLHENAAAVYHSMENVPLVEKLDAVQKKLNPLITPDNAATATQIRDNLTTSINKEIKAFIADPAGRAFAQPSIKGIENIQDKIAASLEYQEKIGKGLEFQPTTLPKQQAEGLLKQYRGLKSADARADFMFGIMQQYGDYTADVLRDMKMNPATVLFVPLLASSRLSKNTIGILLTGMNRIPGDDPQVDQLFDKLEMKDAIAEDFTLFTAIKEAAEKFPGIDEIARAKDAILKAAAYYSMRTGKTDFSELNDALDVDTSEGSILIMPKRSDFTASRLASALEDYRQSENFLQDLKIKNPGDDRYLKLINKSSIQNAVFVMSDDGEHVTVIDANRNRTWTDDKGRVIEIPVKKIFEISEKSGRLTGEVPMSEGIR